MAKKKRTSEQAQQPVPPVPVEHSELPQARRHSIPNPNLITMYANGFQIAIGQVDIRLFAVETFPVSPGEVVDKQLASIIMTPETLKILANNIGSFVKIYEDSFGKIRDFPNTLGPAQTINVPLTK